MGLADNLKTKTEKFHKKMQLFLIAYCGIKKFSYICIKKEVQHLLTTRNMKTFTAIFNKKVCKYDEWNGSHTTITVSSIEITEDGKEIIFIGVGYWGNIQKVYIPVELVDSFIETGKATTAEYIDHCYIGKTWTILN